MSEQRVSCPRHHWLFSVVEQGITIKCRAGECRQVYLVTWAELDAKRQEMERGGRIEEKQESTECAYNCK